MGADTHGEVNITTPEQEVKAKKEERRHFVYHSPNKRFTVVGLIANVEGRKALKFGVAVTKRADLWSPADRFIARIGETKALGQAESKSPYFTKFIDREGTEEKVFLANAYRVGIRRLDEVEQRLAEEETLFLRGRALHRLLHFYETRALRSS